MTLTEKGRPSDLAFVHPKAMGSGVAETFTDVINERKPGPDRLTTLQPVPAIWPRRFFEKA